MNDSDPIQHFIATGSQPAFALVVRRYVDFVYSAARRQVRDADLAEDVTQAVFIILWQRAGSVRNPAALGGWLLQTTHHVACNALRTRRRRASHEKEAAAMIALTAGTSGLIDPQGKVVADQIAGLLDEALSRLGETDRCAVALRFLEGKSIGDVAGALGISTEAAQKRVTRALVKLRDLFARRGIVTAADALPAGLSSQVLHAAPPALVAIASSGGTSAASTAAGLAKLTAKTIFWTHTKAAAAVCAAAVVMASGAAITVNAVSRPAAANPTVPAQAAPIAVAAADAPAPSAAAPAPQPATKPIAHGRQTFPNAIFFNKSSNPDDVVGIDATTRRTQDAPPAGYIKSHQPNTNQVSRAFAAGMEGLRGKRVRLTGWVKTRDVTNWCGLEMCVFGWGQRVLAQCDMGNRPITGTTDWQQYSLVADVPADAQSIMFMAQLRGPGEVWTDGFVIETVGDDVPVNDDQLFHLWSPLASKCSAVMDETTQRNGHATLCVTSNTKMWCAYDHNDRHVEQYIGKRVRVSAWMKADHVTVNSGLWIRMLGPNFQKITDEGNWGKWETAKPIKGTTRDWVHFQCEEDVPMGCQCIVSGMIFNGSGKMWMDDFKFEVVGDATGK